MCWSAKGLLHAVPAAERRTHPVRVPIITLSLVAIRASLLSGQSEVARLDERAQREQRRRRLSTRARVGGRRAGDTLKQKRFCGGFPGCPGATGWRSAVTTPPPEARS